MVIDLFDNSRPGCVIQRIQVRAGRRPHGGRPELHGFSVEEIHRRPRGVGRCPVLLEDIGSRGVVLPQPG